MEKTVDQIINYYRTVRLEKLEPLSVDESMRLISEIRILREEKEILQQKIANPGKPSKILFSRRQAIAKEAQSYLKKNGGDPYDPGNMISALSALGYLKDKDLSREVIATETMTAEQWNAKYPIGTPVIYHPVIGEKEGRDTKTRSIAWTLGHGAPVVSIEGLAGGVLLEALEVLP